MSHTIRLSLESELAEAGVSVAFVLASGEIKNGAAESSSALWRQTQTSLIEIHERDKLLAHPHLRGYHALHERFNVSDPELTPSPESLLRLLFEKKTLRSLGTIVDIYNSISLQYLISIGGHNAQQLGGELKLAVNHEPVRFRPLGQKKKITLPTHEYSYRTTDDRAVCRLECRQANETKIKEDTAVWLFILQGNAQIEPHKLLASSEILTAELAARSSNFRYQRCLLKAGTLDGKLSIPNSS